MTAVFADTLYHSKEGYNQRQMMLEPVSASRDFNPWYPILLGTGLMVIGWADYLRREQNKRASLEKILYVSFICAFSSGWVFGGYFNSGLGVVNRTLH